MSDIQKYKAGILLVEDDESLGFVIKDFLEILDYQVFWAKNGIQGFQTYMDFKRLIDLCLLDIMLPMKDGFSLATQIRETQTEVPIIFLTAKSMKEDVIKGLKLGADDYITKPFSSEELELRIEAILRRTRPINKTISTDTFTLGIYTFDYPNQLLINNEHRTQLTKKEAELLRILCEHQNQLIRREIVLKTIWGDDDYFMGRSMDVYITRLRKYVAEDPKVKIINVHGTGFKLETLDSTFQ